MRGKNLIELLEQRRLLSVTLLHDIASGSNGSYAHNFTQTGSVVIFPALNTGYYGQLWQSDGTSANTSQISSFSTGVEYSMKMASLNGTAYFFANDGTHGFELWNSQGTAATTKLVDDINPGSASSVYWNTGGLTLYSGITTVGNSLFFLANDGTHGVGLWTSDGTTAGTKFVKAVSGGTGAEFHFVDVNGEAYFVLSSGSDTYLWKSDGTAAGTTIVQDMGSYSKPNLSFDFCAVGNLCYFTVSDGTARRLWETDGTNTNLVPGASALSNPYGLQNMNGTLYFAATSSGTTGLWTSDGNSVTLLSNAVKPTSNTNADPDLFNTNWAASARGVVVFFGEEPNTQPAIWRTNGTAAGTIELAKVSMNSAEVSSFNGNIYIGASQSTTGLYRSDGTVAGTVALSYSIGGAGFVAANNELFFEGYTSSQGYEPWVLTDDVAPLIYKSQPNFNQANHSIQFDFDENIGSTLSVSNFTVQKSGSSPIAASAMSLSYDANTSIATLTFPGLPNHELPDGQYSVTVSDAGVKDIAGNAMAANYTTSVEFLMGDANGDRTVNALDFNILATNYGKAGNFTKGDFDYSGTIGSNDFAILASRYGKTVATTGGSMIAQSLSANPPRSLFANTSISQNLLLSDDSSVL